MSTVRESGSGGLNSSGVDTLGSGDSEPTGFTDTDRELDLVEQRLADIGGLAIAEQVGVFTDVHTALARALATADATTDVVAGGTPPGNPGRPGPGRY